jgi:hypothetical protein
VVSHGGNYLLNVGPNARGTFPPEAVERLTTIGDWMKTYDATIYGSTYTPLHGQPWGQATRKDDRIYLQIYNWPEDGVLRVTSFPGQAQTVNIFKGKSLTFSQVESELEINLPLIPPDTDVSVLEVVINPSEEDWRDYSVPVLTSLSPKKYIKDQAIASFIINVVLNGPIALFSYLASGNIPYPDLAIDILITVFIITFFTSWIVVGGARSEYRKGNITKTPFAVPWLRLPKSPILRALVIALIIVLLFGGIFLGGLIYLISPEGMSNWAYILLKTLYAGVSGALASALTILSVIRDQN